MTQASSQPGPLNEKPSMAQLDLMLGELGQLPTLAAVAGNFLSRVTGSEPADAAELQELLRLDPPLTAKLLHMANCFWPTQVGTVGEAIKLLGMPAAKSAILSAQAETLAPSKGENSIFAADFWRHCLAVACASQRMAQRLGLRASAEQAFACGLLHDLGKLAAQHLLPKAYQRAMDAARIARGDIAVYEREILGADHATIGRRLAAQWKLPLIVQQVIWLHHQPLESLPASLEDRTLVAVVGLANALARQLHIGMAGNFLPAMNLGPQAQRLGLSEATLNKIAAELPQEVAVLGTRLGLEQPEDETHYRRALAIANRELAHLNEELRRRETVLAGQAKAFELLREFSGRLSGQATLSDLLEGVAKIFHSSIAAGAEGVVAYSITPHSSEVLCLRFDGQSTLWRALGRRTPAPSAAAATGATAVAIEALLAHPDELADWIDAPSFAHLPLVCAGRWIGGVFMQSTAPSVDWPLPELRESLAGAMAMALDVIQGRERADLMSEQLAGASRVLAGAQEALAEAKTLSTVGEMAAGAAHELNNPLAIISGRAQLMAHKAASEEDRKVWQLVVEQAQRISDIITELMDFASPAPPKRAAAEMRAIFDRAINLFSSSGHPKAAAAKVDIKTGAEVSPAWVDGEQIAKVIAELIGNAAMACRGEPRIHLSAEMDSPHEMVLVSVSDEGSGMDEQTLAQAFTPFFSSQRAGRRRGMGLPKSRRTVENNGGRIWIRSKWNEGTTVYLQLPKMP